MTRRTIVRSTISLLLLTNLAFTQSLSTHEINQRRQQNRVESRSTHEHDAIVSDVKELYFQQRLDHYHFQTVPSTTSSTENEVGFSTFAQRYFYSTRFVNAAGSLHRFHDDSLYSLSTTTAIKRTRGLRSGNYPNDKNATTNTNQHYDGRDHKNVFAFLCVGGEGPSLTKHVLTDSVHCTGDMIELASKMNKEQNANVHIFALEHRYYGNSYPEFNNGSSAVSKENLVYLSSRQALMDVANFVQYTKKEYGLGDNVKFVTFGGSYPGMLAAWSRLKFPHLIYGAVSNSAPVQVVLDFYAYNDVVATALQNPMVGGSEECYNIVQHGHQEIRHMLEKDTDEARKNLADKFNICGGSDALLERKNQNSFVGDGVIHIPAQENDPFCEGDFCNIAKVRP